MPRLNVKDKRRQQLIEANIASIARRGYAETTIAHVSKGAGMSRGIVNFYFTTKEKMMLDTLAFLAGEYAAIVGEAASAPAGKTLEALIAAHFDARLMTPKRLAVWAAFWGHAATHADYRKIIAELDSAHKALLAGAWKNAGGSPDKANEAASELYGMIRGFWLDAFISGERSADIWIRQCHQATLARISGKPATASEKPAKKIPERAGAKVLPGPRPITTSRRPAADDGQMHLDDLFSRLTPK